MVEENYRKRKTSLEKEQKEQGLLNPAIGHHEVIGNFVKGKGLKRRRWKELGMGLEGARGSGQRSGKLMWA
jgi:hypothetical protein